ncbi:MAG: OmpA family protein [Bacteroidetes bacterium]|nr:MAG: OmpA family protein [Bacteroidota bacterium]
MKNLKHLLLLMFLSSIIMVGGYAQEDNTDDKYANVPKRLHEQKDQYDDGEYLFPPKPKNNWSIGIKGGLAFVAGDVKPQPGFGLGLDVRKAIGHSFSVRLSASAGQTTGLNYQRTNGYGAKAGNPWDQYYYQVRTQPAPWVYYNYQMTYGDLTLQGVVNLNNINFYKEQAKWNLYAAGGIGLMGYQTKVDALDSNGDIYNFASIPVHNPDPNTVGVDKKQTIDALKNMLDGEYETNAEGHQDEEGLKVGSNFYVINPALVGALGLRYRLGRRVEVELEHRIVWTNDDLLDGQRWQEHGGNGTTALTRDFDSYHNTTVGIHFRLGKGEESLWWSNPLTEVYSTAAASRDLVKKLTDDADNDGIPDLYDKEPDTPEGTPVDGQGRTLDSDGDGYSDHDDDQPYTPKGCDVDSRGVALDSDSDGVPDCYDKEPGSAPGSLVDAKGITIPTYEAPEGGTIADACILPIIHFDLDKDNIKPQFYPELYYIAQLMRANKDLRIKAIGYSDNRNSDEYNLDLSRRRVRNAVDFISNTYGIDPSRFEVDAKGEREVLIDGLPDNHRDPRLEPLHQVNRRVVFECIKD